MASDMAKQPKFVQPGSFSRPYLHTPPSREMQGGRRQTQVFQDKIEIGDVKNLLAKAKRANIDPRAKSPRSGGGGQRSPTSANSKSSWSKANRGLATATTAAAAAAAASPANDNPKLILPSPPGSGTLPVATADGPDPEKRPSLGAVLSGRAAWKPEADTMSPADRKLAKHASPDLAPRVSSRGTVLRRGSQVGAAPRRHVRQYRHPREMEAALMDSESRIALLEDKLEATTSVLRRTQQELLQRNADLAAAGVKTNSLMLMVRELLQHVTEKREGRRFSQTDQDTLEKIMAQPLEEFQARDNMKDYIDQKINAIDELLPKWTSLPSDFFGGIELGPLADFEDDEDLDDDDYSSVTSSEYHEMLRNPPPLPASKLPRR